MRIPAISIFTAGILLSGSLVSLRPALAETIFSDRLAWEAAVNVLASEDFDSEPTTTGPIDFNLPYTTVNGITIDALEDGSRRHFRADWLVNGTPAPHILDFGAMMTWNPGSSFTAFGFNWDTAIETWEVRIGSSTIATLPNLQTGFFGVTGVGPLSSFVLTSPTIAQGGISVDDMAFGTAIPEPSMLALAGWGLFGLIAHGRRHRRNRY